MESNRGTPEGGATSGRADWITVEGARTHNLRNVSVRVPKHRITVFTGLSGSGKSSLAIGTIAAEAQRLVADSYPLFVRNRLPALGRAQVDRADGLVFATVVDQRPFTGNARSTVGTASDIAPLLRVLFSRIGKPSAGYSPAYSFNDPAGMCPRCEGLGSVDEIDVEALLDPELSLNEGAIRFPTFAPGTYRWKRMVDSGIADPDTPFGRLPTGAYSALLYARGLRLDHPRPRYPKSGVFDGVIPRLQDGYLRGAPTHLTDAEREGLRRVVARGPCPECGGARLNAAALGSLIAGRSIADWSALPVDELCALAADVHDARVAPVVDAVSTRLRALVDVGLGYLSLDRISTTLSGGEAQRVKIVRHLASALSDVCYVFDEPSAGLHPHDVHRLLDLLSRLRDGHNTILIVEHHPAVIAAADHVIDLGPGAGAAGGLVQFEGTPAHLAATDTATGTMLRTPVRIGRTPREPAGYVRVEHARSHNLRDLAVAFPLGVLTAVSGVAGSGKSTLAASELPRRHPDFTVIGQAPLHGGMRSTPATVLGVADPIRRRFARENGLAASWFSPNGRGACPQCRGKGVLVTDLAFLDDVSMPCDACSGTRFNPTALAATLHGLTIAAVQEASAPRAVELFADQADVTRRLQWLVDVGLGHLAIGRAVGTLSGGERQRLLLAKLLADTDAPARLRIVLDEPTVGLHGRDVDRLLVLFDRLVDAGATIIVIEHNQRVIAHADHVIDIGPGAGSEGGTVVCEGAPAGLCAAPGSLTGAYLARAVRPE